MSAQRDTVRFRPGFVSRGVDAADAEAQLHEISARRGALNPDIVVEETKPARASPCGRIVWHQSDAALAKQMRRQIAGDLIGSIQRVLVAHVGNDTVERVQRVFVGYAVEESATQDYAVRSAVLADPLTGESVLVRAMAQLEGWVARYEDLAELAGLVVAVRKCIARFGGR